MPQFADISRLQLLNFDIFNGFSINFTNPQLFTLHAFQKNGFTFFKPFYVQFFWRRFLFIFLQIIFNKGFTAVFPDISFPIFPFYSRFLRFLSYKWVPGKLNLRSTWLSSKLWGFFPSLCISFQSRLATSLTTEGARSRLPVFSILDSNNFFSNYGDWLVLFGNLRSKRSHFFYTSLILKTLLQVQKKRRTLFFNMIFQNLKYLIINAQFRFWTNGKRLWKRRSSLKRFFYKCIDCRHLARQTLPFHHRVIYWRRVPITNIRKNRIKPLDYTSVVHLEPFYRKPRNAKKWVDFVLRIRGYPPLSFEPKYEIPFPFTVTLRRIFLLFNLYKFGYFSSPTRNDLFYHIDKFNFTLKWFIRSKRSFKSYKPYKPFTRLF